MWQFYLNRPTLSGGRGKIGNRPNTFVQDCSLPTSTNRPIWGNLKNPQHLWTDALVNNSDSSPSYINTFHWYLSALQNLKKHQFWKRNTTSWLKCMLVISTARSPYWLIDRLIDCLLLLFALSGALHRRNFDFNAAIDDYLLAMDKTEHEETHPNYKEAQRQLLLCYNDFAVECFR